MINSLPHKRVQYLKSLATIFSCMNPEVNKHPSLMDCVKDTNLYPGGGKGKENFLISQLFAVNASFGTCNCPWA